MDKGGVGLDRGGYTFFMLWYCHYTLLYPCHTLVHIRFVTPAGTHCYVTAVALLVHFASHLFQFGYGSDGLRCTLHGTTLIRAVLAALPVRHQTRGQSRSTCLGLSLHRRLCLSRGGGSALGLSPINHFSPLGPLGLRCASADRGRCCNAPGGQLFSVFQLDMGIHLF